MRKIKSFFMLSTAVLLAFSCKPDPVPEGPKDPMAPVIVSAQLTGVNGEIQVRVGAPVKFTAEVNVQNSELDTYTIEVSNGNDVIATAGGVLKGSSATIEEELELYLSAETLTEELKPTVYLKVTNTDEMYTEKTLDAADVASICPPSLMNLYYMFDNNGNVYELSPMKDRGNFRTYGDISEIGSTLTVSESITSDNKPDGETWSFETPTSEYGIKYIGFNALTGELFKMINYTVILDKAKMDKDCNKYYVYWCQAFIRDCEVVFYNYADGMKIQSDRFANVDGNTARYTGNDTDKFEVYYMEDTNWLTLKGQWSDNTVVWVTGENASAPMTPYCEGHPLNWFAGNPDCAFSAVTLVHQSGNTYEALLYMKENFAIKLYDYWSWANELNWTSITPDTIVISAMEEDPETGKVDGNYGNAGPSFTEGLWVLRYNKLSKEVSLIRYTGVLCSGIETGIPPVEPEPEDGALFLVDNNNAHWTMECIDGAATYRTKEALTTVGTSFVLAEKLNADNTVDWTKKVYGLKDGAIAEIEKGGDYIPVDAAYAVYNKHPWMLNFNTTTKVVTYREGIWKNGMGDMGDGTLVSWVITLPHNCEVCFFDFEKNVSEMVNLAVFDNIDNTNATARYIGASENYETYYRKDQGWLILTDNICTKKMILIGKNASFGQAPYTDYPIIETDIPRTPGQTIQLNKLDDNNYSSYVYLAENASFQLYTDYAWGALNNTWTSATPTIADRENFYAVLGADFYPGVYQITYNESTNKFTLTAKSQKPDVPELTSLYLVNAEGTVWNMSAVKGHHFCTNDSAAEVGSSFYFAEKVSNGTIDWTGRVFGTKDGKIAEVREGGDKISIDPAYATYGKKPWKIGFDADALEVVYREGIWKSGFANNGDGTSVIWVQTLPKNCEVFFFEFTKAVSKIVNTGVFEQIDDVNCCARFVGVSENFEVWMVQDSEWLIFTTNISVEKRRLIGKNASFPQAPYTEYPIREDGFVNTQSMPLHKISDNIFRTDMYLADDFAFYIYNSAAWAAPQNAWTSGSPDLLVPHGDTYTYGTQNTDKTFTPGVYRIEFNAETNVVTITAK